MIALTVTADPEAAARATAERMRDAIVEARARRGAAHLSLAGGRTPARAYRQLARLVDDWAAVDLWHGDERCVPPDHPDSNDALVRRTLLADAGPGPPQLHAVPGVERDAEAAASAYEQELRAALPGEDPPRLDFALLGLGEDGHTASLFPDDPALAEVERLCIPVHGPKPPFARVTLTLPVLLAARRIVVLTEGSRKAWAVGAMLAGPSTSVPASLLAGANVELIVDRAAAPSGFPGAADVTD